MIASKSEQDLLLPSNHLDGPLIMQSHGANRTTYTLIDPFHRERKELDCPEMQGKLCFGCIGKHSFLYDDNSNECFLLDHTSMCKILLPHMPLPFGQLSCWSVSSSLACSSFTVIFAGLDFESGEMENILIFWRLNDEKWTKIPVKVDDHEILCWPCIVHQKNLYVTCSGGIMVFDVPSLIDDRTIETKMIERPEFPKYPLITTNHLYMVESLGDIFMVTIGDDDGVVVHIGIHRLEISSKQVWKRVDAINDRAFLLEQYCGTSFDAKDIGVEPNCIYALPCYGEVRLCKFRLDGRTSTFSFLSEEPHYNSTFCWIFPSRHERMEINISESTSEDRIERNISRTANLGFNEKHPQLLEEAYRPWVDLHVDLFELLFLHLTVVDVVRLRAVCKTWKSTRDPFKKVETWPYLIYNAKSDGTYKFLDPLHEDEYKIKIESHLLDNQNDRIIFVGSKNGWVILLVNDSKLRMLNPFSPDKVISSPPILVNFACMGLSSVPTCPDSILFGINSDPPDGVEIFWWRPESKEEEWDTRTFDNQVGFSPACINPVFLGGDFYCLGIKGEVGVFNPKNMTWDVLNDLRPIHSSEESKRYLLESRGELICAIRENKMDTNIIHIYKLDRTRMAWVELEDLEDLTIFLDSRGSFAKSLPRKNCGKTIFSTAFDPTSNKCLSYCMKGKMSNMERCNLNEPIDCVWLEPNMTN